MCKARGMNDSTRNHSDMGRWQRESQPVGSAQADALLLRALDEMEDAVEQYGELADAAADAESTYRRERAKATLATTLKTDAGREAYALNRASVGDLLVARDIAVAREKVQAEVCRVRRAAVEACRTFVASARAAETGRG